MSVRSLLWSAIVSLAVVTLSATTTLAQGAAISLGVSDHNSDTPVEITSESLELDQGGGAAIFTGNVIVAQGDIRMTCQRMRVEYGDGANGAKNEIKVIRMFGGVTFVSDAEAAESNEAVYTLSNEMLVMSGNVLVTQGPTALSADRLIYDLQSGDGRMEGNVKTVLQQVRN